MLKHVFLLLTGCLISAVALGQSLHNGVVYENKTRVVLQNIRVENLGSNKVVITDKTGAFTIGGKAGELLVFTGAFYKPDTVLLTGNKPLEIFLTPQHNMLNEVNVTATEAIHAGSFAAPEFHNQTVVYHRDKLGNYDGGLTFRLKYFKKDEKKRKQQQDFLINQDQQDQIVKVFNADNIAKYLPLKGKDMDDFLVLYTPSPGTYFSKDFNLLVYLDTSYKAFLKIPADQRNTQLDQ